MKVMQKSEKLLKMAYQIGTQGYALMNDRAFCNCQKRKMETMDSGWEAWSSCWEEYKEAYNGDPDKWLEAYIGPNKKKKVSASSELKMMIKENLIQDVEGLRGESPYVGASIRNVLRSYAVKELKDKIEETSN